MIDTLTPMFAVIGYGKVRLMRIVCLLIFAVTFFLLAVFRSASVVWIIRNIRETWIMVKVNNWESFRCHHGLLAPQEFAQNFRAPCNKSCRNDFE
jgi:hypothetical protein